MRASYELSVPDDTPEAELDEYRELAIATWRTGAECMGGHPGEVTASLVEVSSDSEALHRTGAEPTVSSRVWRVEGEVSLAPGNCSVFLSTPYRGDLNDG